MEQYRKFLAKLEPAQRVKLISVIRQLAEQDYSNLDMKKLKGTHEDLYRVRDGAIRIIFRNMPDRNMIYRIEYRGRAYR
jgi:mRNA-degrading endonuclease RelE of RelBE toxin-antitoxin system